MTPDTARWIRMVLSAFLAGFTAGGALLLNSLSDKGELTTRAIIVAIITGLMMMAGDVKSFLSQPPPSLGGTALPEAAPPLPPPLPLPLAGSALDPRMAVPTRNIRPERGESQEKS